MWLHLTDKKPTKLTSTPKMFYDTNENRSSIVIYNLCGRKKITPTKNIMKTGREIEYIKPKQKNDLNILFNALPYVIRKRDEEDPKRNETKKIIKKYTRPCRAYEKLTNVIEFWLHFVLLLLHNPFFCECVELVTYFSSAFRIWFQYCRWIQ